MVRTELSSKSDIRAVVFDAYGTLFDVHSVIAECDRLFPGQGQAISQAWRTKQLEYSWLLALMKRYEDFWWVTKRALVFACGSIGVDYAEKDIDHLMERYLELDAYPEVSDALRLLTNRNLVILSNGAPSMLEAAVKSAGVGYALFHVISADQVLSYKPDPAVYGLATDALGLNAASIAFVSSNSFDVMGAKSFGFWTCWVNRHGARLDELGITPDIEVSSLTEFAAALGE